MSKSNIFLFFCLSFVGGIFLNSFFYFSRLIILLFIWSGLFLLAVFWSKSKLAVIGFCLLFFSLGLWRHQQSIDQMVFPEEREVSFLAKVVGEPDIRGDGQRLTVESSDLQGKILLLIDRYPECLYGDELQVSGKIQAPANMLEFAYQDFLAKDGIYSIIYSPQLELISRGEYDNFSSVIFSGILKLKNKLRETIDRHLPKPQGSILSAIVLGDKRQLSLEWKDKLSRVGLRHLTAISGMHITILTTVLMSLFLSLGFWRQQAFCLTLALIIIFIILIGCQPSAIRAGIMGGLFLLAQFLGRQGQSWRIIVLAAGLMLFGNPLLLKSDIGFQLSFLAVLGIIFFLPIFRFYLRRVPNFMGVREALSLTLAAQVLTLPVLIFNFGYVSLIAPLSNVLVVPFLPLIMCLGLAFVLLGSLVGFLAMVFSWPLWLILTYLLKITDWFSSCPVMFFQISWLWLVAYFLGIIIFLGRLGKKQELKFLKC